MVTTAGAPSPDEPGFAPIGGEASAPPPPPPPRDERRANLPPPPGYGYGQHAPPPPGAPYAPIPPSKRSPWVRIGVGVGAVALIGGRLFLNFAFDRIGDDDGGDGDFREVIVPFVSGTDGLAVGDCFDDRSVPSADPTVVVDAAYIVVACASSHDAEVYAVVEHPEPIDRPFPGDEVLVAWANGECTARFDGYVGRPYAESSLDYLFLFPDRATWTIVDDRTVVCAARTLNGAPLTGSVAGSGL